MKQVEERYISLLTDFGFKRIFGTAMNKDLLICFLNSLFNGKQVVKDVSYLNPEHVGDVMREYEASKMAYRDIKNCIDTAKQEGLAEGMEKGMELGIEKGMKKGMEKGLEKGMKKGMNQKALEIAKNMLAMGLSAEQVAKATQLPLEIIKNLSNS